MSPMTFLSITFFLNTIVSNGVLISPKRIKSVYSTKNYKENTDVSE